MIPQLNEREFIVAVENPRLGRVVLPNFPLHFTNAKLTRRWEFPVLGRDTETVLRDVVGYSRRDDNGAQERWCTRVAGTENYVRTAGLQNLHPTLKPAP